MNDYKDLIERCKEICAWQDTGLLKGDALRNFAASRPYAQQHNAVSIAQAETLREVADAFIASVDRIAELESSLAATSDMVNKAFADGKAEGHGDATAEASVVIGELRARVSELEKEVKSSKEMETLRYCERQWSDERAAFFKRIAELEAERAERGREKPVAWL